MTQQHQIDPDAGERTTDRDQRIRLLRMVDADAERASVLWRQFTQPDDERGEVTDGR